MAKTIYIKNVHKITLFCNLHSVSKKTAWYNSGTKCICYTYQIPSKYIISAKIEPLKFRTHLLNLSFSRPLQLMKINSTESYVFFLARTNCARIQLNFTNTRGTQYSPYLSRLTGFQIWPSGRNTSKLIHIKIGILNMPKHGNRHDLIHFVTAFHVESCLAFCFRVFFSPFTMGKRELVFALFVHLLSRRWSLSFFSYLLVSGVGCGLWLWHSLDFSIIFCQGHLIINTSVNGDDIWVCLLLHNVFPLLTFV